MFRNKLFFFLVLTTFLISSVAADLDTGLISDDSLTVNLETPKQEFDNKTAIVNGSVSWITPSLGTLLDANDTQLDGTGGTLSIDTSWGSTVWCALTGCTMQGDIDMGNNSITNILSTTYNLSGCDGETPGTFCYDANFDTMRFVTTSSQILQMNQETTAPAKNLEGSFVDDGSVIYIMGSTGENPNFKLARADNLSTAGLVGVVTKDCNDNQVCPTVYFGLVHGIDTTAFTEGDHLYLSQNESGNFTTTPPEFPNVPIWVATAIRIHETEGSIFVFPRLDSANGITMNTLGLVGDFIQTNYSIISVEGNELIGQNVFTIQMNGTTGINIPHLVLQPGGPGQASAWVRSGMVVPESVLCLNSTNLTEPLCFADEAGFTWQIAEFNTSTASGADWGITGELEVINDSFFHGTINGSDAFFDNIYTRDETDELFGSLSLELFFKNTSSGISTYNVMNKTSNDAPKNDSDFTLSADTTELGGFISPNASDLGIGGLGAGVISGHFHANVDLVVGKKDVAGYFQLFVRYGNDTEELLTTSHLVNVDVTSETDFEAHANLLQDVNLNVSDRIVMKLFANLTGSGGNPVLTVYIQGDTLSRAEFGAIGVNFATARDLLDYYKLDGSNNLTAGINGQGLNLTNWFATFTDYIGFDSTTRVIKGWFETIDFNTTANDVYWNTSLVDDVATYNLYLGGADGTESEAVIYEFDGDLNVTGNLTVGGNLSVSDFINDFDGNEYAKYQFTNNNFNGSGNFTTTGNITASFFKGDGSELTGISTFNASYDGIVNWTDGAGATADFNTTGDATTGNLTVNGIQVINPNPDDVIGLDIDQNTAGQQFTGTVDNAGVNIVHKVNTASSNDVFNSYAIKTILTNDHATTGEVGTGTKLNHGNLVNTLVTGTNDGNYASGGSESNAGALVVVQKGGTMLFTGAFSISNAGGFYQVTDNTQGGGVANDIVIENFGGKFTVGGSGRKNGANSLTRDNYGAWFQVTAGGAGATATAYGVYLDTVEGTTNSWGIFDASGADWALDADNQKIYKGEGQDSSDYYNGTDSINNPKEVGTGKRYILGDLVVTGTSYLGDVIINAENITVNNINNLSQHAVVVNSDLNITGFLSGGSPLKMGSDIEMFGFNINSSGNLTTTGQIGIGGTPTSPLHIIPSATDTIAIFLAGNDNPLVSTNADQFGIFSTRKFTPPGDSQPRVTGINSAVAITHDITTGATGFTDTYKGVDSSIVVDSAHSVAAGIIPVITENIYGTFNFVNRRTPGDPHTTDKTITTNLFGANNQISATPTLNNAGTTMTVNAFGTKSEITNDPRLTAGTIIANSYGDFIKITGTSVGTSTGYGLYIDSITGVDTAWGVFDASGADWALASDDQKIFKGEGQDSSDYYNGTDSINNPKEVGTGKRYILGDLVATENVTAGDRFLLPNGGSIGDNSTCAMIFYNSTGQEISNLGCV